MNSRRIDFHQRSLGLLILALATFLVGALWKLSRPRQFVCAAIPAIVYSLFLTPFLTTGAIAHGWAGGYVLNAGEDQLYDVNRACFRYAAEHDGRFPVAETIEDLMPQIEQYLERKRSRYGNPITVHPAAWAFEKKPRPYTWNAADSGRRAPHCPFGM